MCTHVPPTHTQREREGEKEVCAHTGTNTPFWGKELQLKLWATVAIG